jgi:hypothetical protein
MAKAMRTITVSASVRHLENGRLAPVKAHVRQVSQEEYDTFVEAAIQKGIKSIIAVLRRRPPAIPDAFHHPRLGPIGIDFDGAKHIVDQRRAQYPGDDSEATTARVLREVARAAILGHPQEDLAKPGIPHSRVAIVHGDHEVIVEPAWRTRYPEHAKGQTVWIVSGYRMGAQRKADRAHEAQGLAVKIEVQEKK